MTAEQLALDLFPAPTRQTCQHDSCHDTSAVVPAGLFCTICNTLILQYLPESPEMLGYVSADWAWHHQHGNAWTTHETQSGFAMWVGNPRAWQEVS
jgi:hypothetical protein